MRSSLCRLVLDSRQLRDQAPKAGMQFFVNNIGAEGVRSGRWVGSNSASTFETPACLLYTRCGAVPCLGLDLLEDIPRLPPVSQLSISTVYGRPSCATLQRLKKTYHEFYRLEKISGMSYMSVQDPAHYPDPTFNETKNVSIWTGPQRVKLTTDQFMVFQKIARPDVFESLCDILPTTATVAWKRAGKSVDRTLAFLDGCLEIKAQTPALSDSAVFGAVTGGTYLDHRLRSAKETAKRPVDGFAIEGLQILDDNLDSAADIVEGVLNELPKDKPRIFHGPVSPEDILRLLECGVDIFDSSYPYVISENGLALNLSPSAANASSDLSHFNPSSATEQASTSSQTVATSQNTSTPVGRVATVGETSESSESISSSVSACDSVCASAPTTDDASQAPCTRAAESCADGESCASETADHPADVGAAVGNPDVVKRKPANVPLQRSVRIFEVDLNDKRFADDFQPLSPGCRCPACRRGSTRAYTYHLLAEGELLATIHLMQHNLHHYLRFLEAVREAASLSDPIAREQAWTQLKMLVKNAVVV